MDLKEFGVLLKRKALQGNSITEISEWCFKNYFQKDSGLPNEISKIVDQLSYMNLDPQFAYSLDELGFIADELIKGNSNVLETVRDFRRSNHNIISNLRDDRQELADILKNNMYCQVCGLEQSAPPWGKDGQTPSYESCNCCGVIFGCEDASISNAKEFRIQWRDNDYSWNKPKHKPSNWNAEKQMENVHPEYRY